MVWNSDLPATFFFLGGGEVSLNNHWFPLIRPYQNLIKLKTLHFNWVTAFDRSPCFDGNTSIRSARQVASVVSMLTQAIRQAGSFSNALIPLLKHLGFNGSVFKFFSCCCSCCSCCSCSCCCCCCCRCCCLDLLLS